MLNAVRDIFAISRSVRSGGSQDPSSLSDPSECVLTHRGCRETHTFQRHFWLMLVGARTRGWVGILSVDGGLGKKKKGLYIYIDFLKKKHLINHISVTDATKTRKLHLNSDQFILVSTLINNI